MCFLKRIKITLITLILFVSLVSICFIFGGGLDVIKDNWQNQADILIAKASNFFGIENEVGRKILIEHLQKNSLAKLQVFAAQTVPNLPTCPFSGTPGEIYLTNSQCPWDVVFGYYCTLNNPNNICEFIPDGIVYRREDSCHPVDYDDWWLWECGTLAVEPVAFVSYCIKADDTAINEETHLCIIR
jgi:hypothetical protein